MQLVFSRNEYERKLFHRWVCNQGKKREDWRGGGPYVLMRKWGLTEDLSTEKPYGEKKNNNNNLNHYLRRMELRNFWPDRKYVCFTKKWRNLVSFMWIHGITYSKEKSSLFILQEKNCFLRTKCINNPGGESSSSMKVLLPPPIP